MEDSQAPSRRSTIHCLINPAMRQSTKPVARRPVRHALVVLNRAARSQHERDRVLHDQIFRAAGVVQATESTRTAFHAGRPADTMFRIAARIVRSLAGTFESDG